ncbi:MAG: hypothetical protein BroJett039_01250 [Chloroflexota bacterium]|nr:MAG: hypothetical protein BroJett039_01250 [Chloroflexota bacterium]
MAQEKVNIYERIRERVVVYLIEQVGDMAVQGHPHYDKEIERWRVPVYCRTFRGTLLGGEIQLTKRLRIAFATPRQEMVRNVEAQLKQLNKVRLPNLPSAFFSATR